MFYHPRYFSLVQIVSGYGVINFDRLGGRLVVDYRYSKLKIEVEDGFQLSVLVQRRYFYDFLVGLARRGDILTTLRSD